MQSHGATMGWRISLDRPTFVHRLVPTASIKDEFIGHSMFSIMRIVPSICTGFRVAEARDNVDGTFLIPSLNPCSPWLAAFAWNATFSKLVPGMC